MTAPICGELLDACRCALADLEGILPEYDSSGDREHPAWQTIDELRDVIQRAVRGYPCTQEATALLGAYSTWTGETPNERELILAIKTALSYPEKGESYERISQNTDSVSP